MMLGVTPFMKYVIGAGVFVALALVAKFLVLLRFGVDIYVHDTYWVIPIRKIAFWSLMAMAGVSLFIAVYKLVQHSSRPFGFCGLDGLLLTS